MFLSLYIMIICLKRILIFSFPPFMYNVLYPQLEVVKLLIKDHILN